MSYAYYKKQVVVVILVPNTIFLVSSPTLPGLLSPFQRKEFNLFIRSYLLLALSALTLLDILLKY